MYRLILVMAHCGMIEVSDFVESQLAVETKIRVTLFQFVTAIAIRRKLLHLFVTGDAAIPINQPPRATACKELQTGIDQPEPAAVSEAGVKVSHFAQLGNHPALVQQIFVTLQLIRRKVLRLQGVEDHLSRQHAALDRRVNSLQTLWIQKAGAVSS